MIGMTIDMDHTKKYMTVDGHRITISFSQAPNTDLFDRVKSILLSSDEASHNCHNPTDNDKIQQIKKGA